MIIRDIDYLIKYCNTSMEDHFNNQLFISKKPYFLTSFFMKNHIKPRSLLFFEGFLRRGIVMLNLYKSIIKRLFTTFLNDFMLIIKFVEDRIMISSNKSLKAILIFLGYTSEVISINDNQLIIGVTNRLSGKIKERENYGKTIHRSRTTRNESIFYESNKIHAQTTNRVIGI